MNRFAKRIRARGIIFICSGAGVHDVARAGSGSTHCVSTAAASVKICGQMKCTCVSKPPTVIIKPSAVTSYSAYNHPWVTFMTSGLPALPMPTIIPSLIPISFEYSSVIDNQCRSRRNLRNFSQTGVLSLQQKRFLRQIFRPLKWRSLSLQ